MATFRYSARTDAGDSVDGTMAASSQAEALSQLRGQNLTVMSMRQESGWGALSFGQSTGRPRARVSTDDMVLFTRQLSTMISAGIPMLEALEILAEQVENKGFSKVIDDVVTRVRAGSDLSAALGEYPRIFPGIYTNMIRAGEASGQLDEILNRLAEYQEASARLKREIKAAMTYPTISLTLIISIAMFLMLFIVPKFNDIYVGLDIEIPKLTAVMMGTALFMRSHAWYGFFVLVATVIALVVYLRTEFGGRQWDWLKLKLPVFGPLFQKVALSRFSRTFATLIRSGVPILGALEIVAGTAGNRIVADAVDNARESVRQGESLAPPLAESPVFPPMVTRMIAIGERSGALEQLLSKISQFYDEQVEATIESLTSLIEPIMILVMGVIVGSIVLSVFLPIFKLQQILQPKH
jgi:type IV pilus assembly protein PilC